MHKDRSQGALIQRNCIIIALAPRPVRRLELLVLELFDDVPSQLAHVTDAMLATLGEAGRPLALVSPSIHDKPLELELLGLLIVPLLLVLRQLSYDPLSELCALD